MVNHESVRKQVTRAIAQGALVPAKTLPCAHCGKPAQSYHHEDYNKPMEVIALCASCHRKADWQCRYAEARATGSYKWGAGTKTPSARFLQRKQQAARFD